MASTTNTTYILIQVQNQLTHTFIFLFILFTPRLGHSFHSSHSISYYSKLFHFLNSTNHFISFHFFLTFFFNFPNPYTISLNLNHLYHLEIHKVKPFNIFFFSNHSKPFSNHFAHPKEWNGMGKMVCPNKPLILGPYKFLKSLLLSFELLSKSFKEFIFS